ncbi:MAG TPA: hypothetical protein VEO95_13740 [Chthoniobacteraceae bacterium]|nr:hypothetical protein [Chthoniobacteraceae bacterium]
MLAPFVSAADATEDNSLRAWLEPKSMRAPVALPIAGAQRTEIALGRLSDGNLLPFAKSEAQASDELLAAGRATADADLATLTPQYSRDRHKVIQFAELRSPQPIVASAVLAPKFLSLFKSTLGDSVLVVVPNRFTAFVFPALASHYQEYSPMVFEAYHETAYPISVEVFEFSAKGIRAVGVYERP